MTATHFHLANRYQRAALATLAARRRLLEAQGAALGDLTPAGRYRFHTVTTLLAAWATWSRYLLDQATHHVEAMP